MCCILRLLCYCGICILALIGLLFVVLFVQTLRPFITDKFDFQDYDKILNEL